MGRLSGVLCLIAILSAACGGHATADASAGGSAGGGAGGAGDAGEAEDAGGAIGDIPGPGPVAQPAGVLYQGAAWTRAADAVFGASTCRIRPSLPGCEGVSSPSIVDAAVAGQRLLVLVNEDPSFALLVSDDLGKTVRRFALGNPFSTDGRALALHLFEGRVFVLAEFADPSLQYSNSAAHVFEVDPVQGGIAQRGADATMSGASGYAAPDGSFTSVGYARDRLPQLVAITRFDPKTNRVSRAELPCAEEACQVNSAFISSDGKLFNALTAPSTDSARCLVTAHADTNALETECSAELAGNDGTPLRAFGSTSYDFKFVAPDPAVEPDAPWSLVPVLRNWLSAGPPISFAPNQLFALDHGFFAFSPSAFASLDDGVLLRLQPTGVLEQSTLVQDGCLTLSPFRNSAESCAAVVRALPLAGSEVLLISRRDESHDDDHSRWVFEIGRSNAPFTPFKR